MSSATFDRIAPYYDRLARLVYGNRIRRAQCYFLDQIPPASRVLVVGGGTGWLLPCLLDKPEVKHITYLEASATMLEMAQQKVRYLDKHAIATIDFIHGDEHCLLAEDRFQVVITNFVLDMYEGKALDRLMQTLLAHLEPAGYWLFTDFRITQKRVHRWWQQWMTKAMYLFFHLTAGIARQTLPPYHQHFAAHGLHMTHERSFFSDFIVSRVYRVSG